MISIKSRDYTCDVCKGEYSCFFKDNSGLKYSILENMVEGWEDSVILVSDNMCKDSLKLETKDIHIMQRLKEE